MTELLLLLIFLMLTAGAYFAYSVTRDALNPVMVLSPFFLYTYCYRPFLLHQSGDLYRFVTPSDYEFVCYVNFFFLAAFVFGGLFLARRVGFKDHFDAIRSVDTPNVRSAALSTGLALGTIAFFVFWHTVWYNGGPTTVFSQKKPFLVSPIGIGYYNELPLLTFPAMMLIAIAWQGQRISLSRMALLLFIASPQLVWGTLGGRRGPAFMVLCVLLFVILTIRRTRFSPFHVLVGAGTLGILLIALTSVRGDLFRIGMQSEAVARVNETLMLGVASEGDEVVYAASQIIHSNRYDRFFWGARYFTLFFIRPIPSFILPNKYDLLGMSWMVDTPGSLGYSAYEWEQMQGFSVALGSAGGFISDLFIEFWWLGIFASFLLGWFFDFLRKRSLVFGGVWTMIFFMSLSLSIYLPTQNIEAWGYRQLLISGLLLIFWQVRLRRLWTLRNANSKNSTKKFGGYAGIG